MTECFGELQGLGGDNALRDWVAFEWAAVSPQGLAPGRDPGNQWCLVRAWEWPWPAMGRASALDVFELCRPLIHLIKHV